MDRGQTSVPAGGDRAGQRRGRDDVRDAGGRERLPRWQGVVGRIERNDYGTGLQRADDGDREVRARIQTETDPVARGDADRTEIAGEAVGVGGERGPRQHGVAGDDRVGAGLAPRDRVHPLRQRQAVGGGRRRTAVGPLGQRPVAGGGVK